MAIAPGGTQDGHLGDGEGERGETAMSKSVRNVSPLAPNDPTLTLDTFVAEVPAGQDRVILVYLRKHGGKQYIRWRYFHRHKTARYWYPDAWRWFVIPISVGEALAAALVAAHRGDALTAKPKWLAQVDAWRQRRCLIMDELNAPPQVLDLERRRAARGYGMGRSAIPSERAQRRRERQLANMEKA